MKNIEDMYELSPMQQGMLFHTLYAPTSGTYFNQLTSKIKGNLDTKIFKQCWEKIAARYAVFRTSFHWENLDNPVQVVRKAVVLPWAYHDWRDVPAGEQETRFRYFLDRDRQKGFDPDQAPLVRCTLIRLADETYRFIFSFHHILMDGWCTRQITKNIMTIYEALSRDRPLNLEPTRPYRDFIRWLQLQDKEKAKKYWQKELKGFHTVTFLCDTTWQNPPIKYQKYTAGLSPSLTNEVRALARSYALTLNALAQGAWSILLSRYKGTPDVMYGTTVSGRPPVIPGVETMMGLFINTLPVRVRIDKKKLLLPWLKEFQEKQAQREEYGCCSLMDIRAWSDIPGGTPMFDSLVVYENYPGDESRETNVKQLEFIDTDIFEQGNYPLNILFLPAEQLAVKIHYDANGFEPAAIHWLAGHLLFLIEGFVKDPGQPIFTYSLFTDEEKHLILTQWNNTPAEYPSQKCIHEWWAERAETMPNCTALKFKEQVLTYGELNRRANRWAHYLQKIGVGPDVLVGICLGPSLEMIIGVLAILKAGGAYLPLTSTLPGDRLRFIVKDAGIQILLTREKTDETLPGSIPAVIYPDTPREAAVFEPAANPVCAVRPVHLAYVIYTSGSTGRPKGVLLNHQGVCNLIKPQVDMFDIQPGDMVLQFASLNFDASVSEIFTTILSGAVLVLGDKDVSFSPHELPDILRTQRINIVTLPPVVLKHLAPEPLPDLKTIVSAGESCPGDTAGKWSRGRRFINAYGPTENTVCTTMYRVKTKTPRLPIGKPIANTRVYILNNRFQLAAIMVPGELCISGVGLARGYLNHPKLTAGKFTIKSFCGGPGGGFFQKEPPGRRRQRIYRTGDWARWLADGNIEFLGRIDNQVKIRGFRIEPGEIEHRLSTFPGIKDAVVIAVNEAGPGSDNYLCAFFVTDGTHFSGAPDIVQIKNHLSRSLPYYMVPSYFTPLNKIPMTTSGKVHRRALKNFERVLKSRRSAPANQYAPPGNEIEEKLVKAMRQVLKIEKIGINHDFFEMGGNSIKAIQVVSRLAQLFDISISIPQLFKYRTAAQLAPQASRQKDNLVTRLKQLKHELSIQENQLKLNRESLDIQYRAYKQQIEQDPVWALNLKEEKDYRHILLTGAAGFLGAHLVPELLTHTKAILHLPVRAAGVREARERLKKKFAFYFGDGFKNSYWERIEVLPGDLSEDYLGLSLSRFESLWKTVDMVLHAAAKVKHYGRREDFVRDNVTAVQQLLEFTKKGKKKDFHYISTTSVGTCRGHEKAALFTEYSQKQNSRFDNIYLESKSEAEKKVTAYRQNGLNTSIYRVGNLVAHSETGKFQENIEDNAFYAVLKSYISLGIMPDNESELDLSFIDYAARALRLLVTRKNPANEVFHLDNTRQIPAEKLALFLKKAGIRVKRLKQEKFLDAVIDCMDDGEKRIIIDRFLLHWGIFETGKTQAITRTASERTRRVLEKLGFDWPDVTEDHIKKMIRHCRDIGFIHQEN